MHARIKIPNYERSCTKRHLIPQSDDLQSYGELNLLLSQTRLLQHLAPEFAQNEAGNANVVCIPVCFAVLVLSLTSSGYDY